MCKLILGHSLSLHSIECKLIGYEFPLGKLICRQTIFSFCTDNFLFLYDIFCTEWGEIREFWKNPWVYNEFTKLTLSSEWTQTQYWVHMWVYLGKLDSLDVSWVQWHNFLANGYFIVKRKDRLELYGRILGDRHTVSELGEELLGMDLIWKW